MPEVQHGLVEHVDDEEKLCGPEVAAYPEHDEAEGQQIVDDEMGAHIGGAVLEGLIAAPQVSDVVDLEHQDNNPVNASDDGVEAEGRWSVTVLAPYGVAMVVVRAVRRTREGIDDASHDDQ